MPDSPAHIEGKFYIDPDGKLAVVKRDYQTMQVGKTKDKKEKGVVVEEGKPIFEAVPVSDLYDAPSRLTGQQENRVRAMMTIHDRARELLYSERTGEPEEDVESKRAQLRAMHTEFVRRFGGLNSPQNINLFKQDPGALFIQSLERQRGGTWYGADIFTRRQLQSVRRAPVQTPTDAMTTVMDELGKLDFDRMGKLLDRPAESVRTDLANQGYIYHDPVNNTWETSDVYLAGSVRGKLDAARDATTGDSAYNKNVEELEKHQPDRLRAREISIHLGAPWIPDDLITQWYRDTVDPNGDGAMRHQFDPVLGQWVKTQRPTHRSIAAQAWGTTERTSEQILDAVMANRIIEVKTKGEDGRSRKDPAATLAAQTQAQRMRNSFENWVKGNSDRADGIEDIYNTKMNDIRIRTYEGSHQTFPGMETEWQRKIHPHQSDAVFRTVQDGTALLAHEVGFGKTLSMVASAMERRRLELSDKPIFVMPKNVHAQTRNEFLRYYPDAKVLFPEDGAFTGTNKANFLSRARDGDWDAVILTMEQFKAIPVRPEVSVWWQEDRVNELEHHREELDSKFQATKPWEDAHDQLERGITKIDGALDVERERLGKERQDADDHNKFDGSQHMIYFEDLGVDQLYVDEADNYKNLGYNTKLGNIKGLPNSDSDRSWDMFMKAQIVQGNARSTAAQADPSTFSRRGVVFATGTPVANTVAETWTMMRYLQLDELRKRDMHNFDSWAANYGKVVTDIEQTPQGTYRETSRFASFHNLPELSKLFQRVSDVRVASEVPKMLAVQPRLIDDRGNPRRITVKAPAYPALQAYVKDLDARADAIADNDPREVPASDGGTVPDNMLKLSGDARRASLDIRMVNWPGHMREAQEPNPSGKIPMAVENIAKVYNEEAEDKGVQIVFLDLGTPRADSGKDKSATADGGDDGEVAMSQEDNEVLKDAYRLVREGLAQRGVSDDQIAFIHDYTSNEARATLFDKIRQGDIRVLVGSTAKVGVGVNIQDRAAAIHHIDVPWRPRDLEQREGRIVRQGNHVYGPVIDEATGEVIHPGRGVKIYQYVQEGSFDEFMWQGVEKKGIAIKALMKRNIKQREIEDVDPLVMGAAEAKALSSGDKRVGRLVDIKQKITKLRLERSSYDSTKFNADEQVAQLESRLATTEEMVPKLRQDSELAIELTKTEAVLGADGQPTKDRDGKPILRDVHPFTAAVTTAAGREPFNDRMEAGAALVNAIKDHRTTGEWKTLGDFHGLKVEAYNGGNAHQLALTNPETGIRHESSQLTADTIAPRGVMSRLDNVLDGMIGAADDTEDRLGTIQEQLTFYKTTSDQPFERAEELGDIEAQADLIQEHLTGSPDATAEEVRELLGDVQTDVTSDNPSVNPDYNPPKTRTDVIELQEQLRDATAKARAMDDEVAKDERVEIAPVGDVDLGTVDPGPDEPVVRDPADRPTPTGKNPYPKCLCGCGSDNNPGSRFKPGHDAKAGGILKKVAAGTLDASAIPQVLLEAAQNNPDLVIHGHTANEILTTGGREPHPSSQDVVSEPHSPPPTTRTESGEGLGIPSADVADIATDAASDAIALGADQAEVELTDNVTGETTTISVKKEPDGDFKIQPTASNLFPYCLCGCGAETSSKATSKFKMGHDSKAGGLLKKVAAGTLDASAIPQVLLEAAQNNPDLVIHGHTANEILEVSGQGSTDTPNTGDEPASISADVPASNPIERDQSTMTLPKPKPVARPRPKVDPDDDGPPEKFLREASSAPGATATPDLDLDIDLGDDGDGTVIRRKDDFDYEDEDGDEVKDEDGDDNLDDIDVKYDDTIARKYESSISSSYSADEDEDEDDDDDGDDDDYDYSSGYHYGQDVSPVVIKEPVASVREPQPSASTDTLVGKSIPFRIVPVVEDEDEDDNAPYQSKLKANEADNMMGRAAERIADDLNEDKAANGVAVITAETLDAIILEETKDEGLLEGAPSAGPTGVGISLENIPDAPTPSVKVDDIVVDTVQKDRGYDKSIVDTGARGGYASSDPKYQQRGGRGKYDFRK